MALNKMKRDATDNAVTFLQHLKRVPLHPEGRELYLKYKNTHKDYRTDHDCISKTEGSIAVFVEVLSEAYSIDEQLQDELELPPIVHFNTVSKYYWTLALDTAWALEERRRKHTSKFCLAKVFNEVGCSIYEYL
jgi:hypothetical protein